MKDRLEVIAERYNQISEMLLDMSVVSDIKKLTALSKEQKSLEKIVIKYNEYKQALEDITLEFEDIQKEYENDVNAFDESELFDDLDD
jgi:peptide chain release factor 1